MKKIYNAMTKTIISSILIGGLSSSLFSQDFLEEDYYSKALISFQKNSFNESYLNLSKYLQNNKLNKNLAFILGRSAYEIGKFEEALVAYDFVLKEEPNNIRVKLEVAQTYFQMQRYDDAKVIFEEVLLKENIPSQVRKNIELTLATLNTKNKRNFLKTTLVFGFGYDSNIENYSSDYLDLSSTNKKTDMTTEYILSLNHMYKMTDSIGFDNKFVGYSQKYNDYTNNNIDLVILGSAISYYLNNYKLSLGFDYNHVWLNNNHYLNNYALIPSLQYKVNKELDYIISFKTLKKDFKQTEYNYKDSIFYEIENTLNYSSEKYGINIFSTSLGTENKSEGEHYNIDNKFVSLKYDNRYPLTKELMLTNSIEYYKDLYDLENTIFNNTRRTDDKITLNTGVIKSIDKNLSLGANLNYIDNNSNQDLFYTYDKYSLKTNIYYSF